jgi:hypothetical protein
MIDSARAACARHEAEIARLHAAIELVAARLEGCQEAGETVTMLAGRARELADVLDFLRYPPRAIAQPGYSTPEQRTATDQLAAALARGEHRGEGRHAYDDCLAEAARERDEGLAGIAIDEQDHDLLADHDLDALVLAAAAAVQEVAKSKESWAHAPRRRLLLDPDLADGHRGTLCDLVGEELVERLRIWMADSPPGARITLELLDLSDAEVEDRPDLARLDDAGGGQP